MIFITYDEDDQIKELTNYSDIQLIDSRTKKGKKEAWKLKSHWGAKIDPFVLVTNNENVPIKAFYSEAGNSIFNLINYLDNEKG